MGKKKYTKKRRKWVGLDTIEGTNVYDVMNRDGTKWVKRKVTVKKGWEYW
jgi:hypothetical protein